MRQHIYCQVAWTRRGIRKWEDTINDLIGKGWELDYTQVIGRFRLVLVAVFHWKGSE